MALACDLIEEWGGGDTYRFALPIGQLEELDEKTGGGPLAVLTRLLDGSWRLPDVRDTIRLALVGGGGVKPAEAVVLVRRHVDARPLEDAVPLAAAILMAALRGRRIEIDDAGNGTAAKSVTDPTGSTSPPSDAMPSL